MENQTHTEAALLQPRLVRQFASEPEQIDDIIDEWHDGKIECEHLHEALGWTCEQYKSWVETSVIPLPNASVEPPMRKERQ
jgi:hypothetical protein